VLPPITQRQNPIRVQSSKSIPITANLNTTEQMAAGSSSQEPETAGPRASVEMVTIKDNVWAERVVKDGQDRSHVPPVSMVQLRLRIAQMVLAVIFLVLASFSAFTLNVGNVSSLVHVLVSIGRYFSIGRYSGLCAICIIVR
jgi:hypothetical protein